MKERLVIETSTAEKQNLDLLLNDQGTTLRDWFADRVTEGNANHSFLSNEEEELESLRALDKPKAVLANLSRFDWAFTTDATGYLTHGLHPYPAKFIPQIPRRLIQNLSMPGEMIWDPFGGSGTTALEAVLLQRRVVSSDVNPLSKIIGLAKTVPIDRATAHVLLKLATRLELMSRDTGLSTTLAKKRAELADETPDIPNIEKWFCGQAIEELAFLKKELARLQGESARSVALSAFSKIILKASNQDNETRYASKPKVLAVGQVIRMFSAELRSAVTRCLATAPFLGQSQAKFLVHDARQDSTLEPASIDAIVTSPPYPNATDYHLYHRFRLYWLGFSPQDLGKAEIGSHLRHQKEETGIDSYVKEMTMSLAAMHRALRPGRYAAIVVGDAMFNGRTFSTSELLADAATSLNFQIVGTISRDLHSTKRSFIKTARRLRSEQILLVRRKPEQQTFTLSAPPYRMWPYEEQLRAFETREFLGLRALKGRKGQIIVPGASASVERMRRLTFSHGFSAPNYSMERTWQAVLENGDCNTLTGRKDPKYATHGIHAYKGKFYPQLAKSLLNICNMGTGSTVLDPFCGSGTVLLEAKLNGVHSIGVDLNPLAAKIARAKVYGASVFPRQLDELFDDTLSRLTETDGPAPGDIFEDEVIRELESWFPKEALVKLARIIAVIEDVPDSSARELLELCISSIVREVSHQDPRDLRIRRRKDVLSNPPVVELFRKQVMALRARIAHFAERKFYCPTRFGDATVIHGDARHINVLRQGCGKAGMVDGVITSPPYATALPYIDTDRLSLLLLLGMRSKERTEVESDLTGSREIRTKERLAIETKIDNHEFAGIGSTTATRLIVNILKGNRSKEVGFRRRNQAALLYRYYSDLTKVMQNLDKVVRRGGSLCFVIGDNITNVQGSPVAIRSARAIQEIGAELGWDIAKVIPITVTQDARPHNRNGITENEIIWFKK